VSVVCYQVDISATGQSLVQRSLTECGVPEYDRKPHRRVLGPLKLSRHDEKKSMLRNVPICDVSCFRDNNHKVTPFRRTSWKPYKRNS
jgi:hypothetical protein